MKKRLLLIGIVGLPLTITVLALLGLFKLIGITYSDNWALVHFFIVLVIIEVIVDNVVALIPVTTQTNYTLIFIKSCLSLAIADWFESTVTLATLPLIALAITLTLLEYCLDKYTQ